MRPLRLLVMAVGVLGASGLASGQSTRDVGQGLDALDEDRVLTELAGRGLSDLLRHAFERQNVPEAQRNALLARISLNRLQGGEELSTGERRQLVTDVVANVGQTIAEADEPQLLFEQAQLLIDKGVSEEARLLEYFGENPELRRYLRPVADAVSQMFNRSAELYTQQADEVANRIQSPDDVHAQRWQKLNQEAQLARQYGIFADYNRVLASDPDDPQRLVLADKLLEIVSPFDTEGAPRRTFIQLYLGKLALARGNEKGLALAREYLEQVIETSSDEAELFDAYYFRTIAEIADRNVQAAREQFERYRAWFDKQTLPDREPLMLVVEYRLQDAIGKYATDTGERNEGQRRATEALVTLMDNYEGYRSIVTDQLLGRMASETDLASLSVLLLDALVDKGRAEAAKLASGESGDEQVEVDREAIRRGIAAGQELVSRARANEGAAAEADPQVVSRAAFLVGLMQDLLGDDLAAAETFIAFSEVPGAEQQQKVTAYRRAIGILDELQAGAPDEAARVRIDELEGRLLPLLVDPPVNDKSRAFDLANRLHRLGRLDEAVEYYEQVPENDPRATDARYLRILAEATRLSEMKPDSPGRATLVRELPELGAETLDRLQEAVESAGDEDRDAYRTRLARLKTVLARFALNEQGDAQRALELLSAVESDVNGLAEAQSLLNAALPLRFQATAAAGDIDQATQDLLTLLEQSDAQRGLGYITRFRESLNRALDAAAARGDDAAVRRLIETRAGVTPKLVSWIEASDDPDYRRYIYNFRRFNAETLLQAAQVADNEKARQDRLREALAAYEALETPENMALYRQLLESLSESRREQVPYDRDVMFAIANIHFDLGNFADARTRYARLLDDRAMGNAMRTIEQDGVTHQVPNDDYWQLYLNFIRSNLELGNPREPMRKELEKLYILHGDAVGGTRWREAFEELGRRMELELEPDLLRNADDPTRPSFPDGATQ